MSKTLIALGTEMKKKSGSEWQGYVVGHYSTTQTPEGVAIESKHHEGSVQIYPVHALVVVK